MLVFHRCWKTKVSPAEVQHPLHANGVALQVGDGGERSHVNSGNGYVGWLINNDNNYNANIYANTYTLATRTIASSLTNVSSSLSLVITFHVSPSTQLWLMFCHLAKAKQRCLADAVRAGLMAPKCDGKILDSSGWRRHRVCCTYRSGLIGLIPKGGREQLVS